MKTILWIVGTIIIIFVIYLIAKNNKKDYHYTRASGSGVKSFIEACCARLRK